MYQGNWKCSSCGGKITELPFEPRSESGLTCRTCYVKQKNGEKVTAAADEVPAASEDPAIPDDAEVATEPAPTEDIGENTDATSSTPGERPKFSGDWKCSSCGTEITSLPFEPRSTANLKCIDCFKARKQ